MDEHAQFEKWLTDVGNPIISDCFKRSSECRDDYADERIQVMWRGWRVCYGPDQIDQWRGWLEHIEQSNDPHAATCARYALDGHPAPGDK